MILPSNMRFDEYSFGRIKIDGVSYDYDVVIDRGKIYQRQRPASNKGHGALGHTPLSLAEEIPWECCKLVIGTGMHGAMPVLDEVMREAKRRNVEVVILPTAKAIQVLESGSENTNAILHLTC